MTKEEIKQQVLDGQLSVTDVIDVVVEVNALIGVGLITLGDQLKEYCYSLLISPYQSTWSTTQHTQMNTELSLTLRHAYLDIDGLLQEGFDTNAEEQLHKAATGQPHMESIVNTLKEIDALKHETAEEDNQWV